MTNVLLSIALVLLFILIGGLFAGAEMALVSLRDSQIEGMAKRSARGKRVARLAANPNRFLAAVQIGVTLSGFMSAAFGEATLAGKLRPVLRDLGAPEGLSHVFATVIITLIVAYFSLVFGELVPKRIALQRAEGVALVIGRPLDRFATIARPAVWLLSRSTNLVVRLIGADPGTAKETITQEELRGLVAAHDELTDDERALIDDVFAAGDRQVSEVMIPRTEVDFLDGSMTASRAARIVADSPHSRYPVVGENQDDVIGFVHVRDLLTAKGRAVTVADLAREVEHLPGSKNVLAALSEMRRAGNHVAIVVDEYGGTDGLVTLEDLIEEVIGEIRDEYDVSGERRHRQLATGETEVDGLLNLDDFAEATSLQLPDGPYETVGGYVMSTLRRLPAIGDQVEHDGRNLIVAELDGRRIAKVRVTPSAGVPSEQTEPAAS